ncbi:hypothetical protein [Flavobacterium sp. WG21]|uniref:hypothetical protein n=1 Tax=Flavobacterium sp. WG21 TaxID=1229487 RepID=UPI00036CA287|nr:hypothetical protein [Flavobacterium sp. WG21]
MINSVNNDMQKTIVPRMSGIKNVMLSDDYCRANSKTDNLLWFFILAQRLTYAT